MARTEKPRDRNRYPDVCCDCHASIEIGAGFLYRHSGANLGGMKKSMYRRSKFVIVVRCESCALKHDGPKGRAAIATQQAEWSGITYTGYGANTHAPCGN